MDGNAIELVPDESIVDPVASFGGSVLVPAGSAWPACKLCGEPLVLFLQSRLPDSGGKFTKESLLQIFACRQHADIAGTIYSEYDDFSKLGAVSQLPPQYWDISDGHYLLRLLRPDAITRAAGVEGHLLNQPLRMEPLEESESRPVRALKLFGTPSWIQNREIHQCACGAPMELLLEVPEHMEFPIAPGAATQPNSYSKTHYKLFLGNELYLCGCVRQCNPLALWPVLQN